MPKSSTPALFEITVRFLIPFRRTAAIRFSGRPQRPKPPIMILAPSGMSRIAPSALATTLFIAAPSDPVSHHSAGPLRLSKLFRQLFRAQVRAQPFQFLFQPLQRPPDVVAVGQANVTPHLVRAGRQPDHFAEPARRQAQR